MEELSTSNKKNNNDEINNDSIIKIIEEENNNNHFNKKNNNKNISINEDEFNSDFIESGSPKSLSIIDEKKETFDEETKKNFEIILNKLNKENREKLYPKNIIYPNQKIHNLNNNILIDNHFNNFNFSFSLLYKFI